MVDLDSMYYSEVLIGGEKHLEMSYNNINYIF